MTDEELFRHPKKIVFKRSIDTGGMFDETFHIAVDDDESHQRRYYAARKNGWGGGKGRRHTTLEEATKWIEKELND